MLLCANRPRRQTKAAITVTKNGNTDGFRVSVTTVDQACARIALKVLDVDGLFGKQEIYNF
ncbi:hypothetical protein SAMN05216419_103016 [Nitrosomonas cryotolerans]|uniref:Uncharacterized protein n=1 Tax=Nitrosomonas cryotolerans ATCC 49181 TaxID=1131553 RepID=A0A1N6IID9_9PROT|nr:hypothetical protein SAMN05216419_103016 [Nitrosomonas cryotolerans]SIO31743.1 hypothetical protein SAMN02743940_1835 [Nitrosomonas cryotolerans ATCC 49181]